MGRNKNKNLSEQKKLTFCISFDEIMKVLYKEIDRKNKFNDSQTIQP